MSQRRASAHNRCRVCRINAKLCVCPELRPIQISSQVSLVVHVSELKLTSNTAQFVELMLPQSAQCFVRGRVHETFTADSIVKRPGRALFLYPCEDAQELNAEFVANNPGPFHLIIPDGNWHQARKVRNREEDFKNMTAVKLPAGIRGEYRLRKAPQPEWVSTYEAVAHALGILEDEAIRDQMMVFFRHWVENTLQSRAGAASSCS